jgi:dTDP-4-amino-4,6-dideoxygalactose transaminase
VAHAGNRVIFADSDPMTMGLDPEDVARKIDENTAAVMAVHIGGIISPDIKVIKDLCDSKGLYLLEDCAHAHGSTMNGVHAGLIGVAGGFSFFPTKTLTTGEGGMMITDDEEVYKKALMLRNQGKNPALGGKISEFGHNWRLSETTAVIGVQQMKSAGRILEDRGRIARYYDQALQEFKGIKPLKIPEGSTSSFYKYLAYLDPDIDRGEVKKRMREEYKVALPGEVYADLCHNEPVWDTYTYCGKRRNDGGPVECNRWPGCGCSDKDDKFPRAEYLSKHHVCLPMYPGLTKEELAYVVESLDHVLQGMAA